ncbi:MAG: hypothetical protein WCL42_06595 [Chlorobiaceae bacterium]|jgi:hypothetical protein
MVTSISAWFSATVQWVHFLKESARLDYSGLKKWNTVPSGIDSHKSSSRILSTEEEIIIQMAKEYPTLFIT